VLTLSTKLNRYLHDCQLEVPEDLTRAGWAAMSLQSIVTVLALELLLLLVPFAILALMPGWKSLGIAYAAVTGLLLWCVLELPGTAEAGAVLIFFVTLVASGGFAGLVTGSANIVLRSRGAGWQVRGVALAFGALSSPVLWAYVVTNVGRPLAWFYGWSE
jgi:hypothetical protein